MNQDWIRSAALVLAFLASACVRSHVHGPACESGMLEEKAREAPASRTQASPPAAPPAPAPELTSAAALAAFDEAWQTIHDTHFDPTFNGVDWDAVKTELRPRAEQATTRAELRAVLGEMVGRLGQSHFAVIPSDALPDESQLAGSHDQSGGLGFDVREREGELLVVSLEPDGAAVRAGVQRGWIVKKIGDFDAHETFEHLRTASVELGERKTDFHLWAAARAQILGPPGTREQVLFADGAGKGVELELERRPRSVTVHTVGATLPTFYLEFTKAVHERGGRRIGYLHFSNWFLPVMKPMDEAMDEMRSLDGIVLDLRGNTGGAAAMTMGVGGHFFAETTRLGVMTTRDSTVNILALPRTTNAAGELVVPFAGPLAILTDETTASASEVFAGGLQSVGRARVFGETSNGAVLPAMTTRLPNGDSLLHAMGDFETVTGKRLEGVGVVPDVLVPLRRAELLAGHDAQLDAALDWIASLAR